MKPSGVNLRQEVSSRRIATHRPRTAPNQKVASQRKAPPPGYEKNAAWRKDDTSADVIKSIWYDPSLNKDFVLASLYSSQEGAYIPESPSREKSAEKLRVESPLERIPKLSEMCHSIELQSMNRSMDIMLPNPQTQPSQLPASSPVSPLTTQHSKILNINLGSALEGDEAVETLFVTDEKNARRLISADHSTADPSVGQKLPSGADSSAITPRNLTNEERDQIETSAQRFFFDLWMAERQEKLSSNNAPDALNIDLLIQLDRALQEAAYEYQMCDDASSVASMERNPHQRFADQRIAYVQKITGTALDIFDRLIQEVGHRFPLLKSLRQALLPAIFVDRTLPGSTDVDNDFLPTIDQENQQPPHKVMMVERLMETEDRLRHVQLVHEGLTQDFAHINHELMEARKLLSVQQTKAKELQTAYAKCTEDLKVSNKDVLNGKEEIKALKTQLDKVQKQAAALKAENDLKAKVIETNNQQLQAFETKVKGLDTKLAEQLTNIEKFKKEIGDLKKERREVKKELTQSISDVKNFRLRLLRDRRELLDSFDAAKENARQQCQKLNLMEEDESHDEETNKVQYTGSLPRSKSLKEVNEEEEALLELAITDIAWQTNTYVDQTQNMLSAEIKRLKQVEIDLNANVDKLVAEKAKMLEEHNEKVAELQSTTKQQLKAMQQSAESIHATLRAQLQDKGRFIEELQGTIRKHEQNTRELQHSLSTLQMEHGNLQAHAQEIENNLSMTEYDVRFEERLLVSQEAGRLLTNTLQTTKTTLQKTEQQLQKCEADLVAAEQATKAIVKAWEEKHERALNQQFERFEKQRAAAVAQQSWTDEQLAMTLEDVASGMESRINLHEQISTLTEQVDELTLAAEERDESLEELEEQVAELSEEVETITQAEAELQAELQTTQQNLTAANKQIALFQRQQMLHEAKQRHEQEKLTLQQKDAAAKVAALEASLAESKAIADAAAESKEIAESKAAAAESKAALAAAEAAEAAAKAAEMEAAATAKAAADAAALAVAVTAHDQQEVTVDSVDEIPHQVSIPPPIYISRTVTIDEGSETGTGLGEDKLLHNTNTGSTPQSPVAASRGKAHTPKTGRANTMTHRARLASNLPSNKRTPRVSTTATPGVGSGGTTSRRRKVEMATKIIQTDEMGDMFMMMAAKYKAVTTSVENNPDAWRYMAERLHLERAKFRMVLQHHAQEKAVIQQELEQMRKEMSDLMAKIPGLINSHIEHMANVKMMQLVQEEATRRMKQSAMDSTSGQNAQGNVEALAEEGARVVETKPVKLRTVELEQLFKLTRKIKSALDWKKSVLPSHVLYGLNKKGEDGDEDDDDDAEEDTFDENKQQLITASSLPDKRRERWSSRDSSAVEVEPFDKDKLERRSMLRSFTRARYYNRGTQTYLDATTESNSNSNNKVHLLERNFHVEKAKAMFPHRSQADRDYTLALSKLSPHQLSQPFVGYIRQHEKQYAREIGLLKVALRECRGLYDRIMQCVQFEKIKYSNDEAAKAPWEHLEKAIQDHQWVFSPKVFVQKMVGGPLAGLHDALHGHFQLVQTIKDDVHHVPTVHLQDPLDITAQARMIVSYRQALEHEQRLIAQGNNMTENGTERHLVIHALEDLIVDLHTRMEMKGGWPAVLYRADGTMDLDLDLSPFTSEETIEILREQKKWLQVHLKSQEDRALKQQESLYRDLTSYKKKEEKRARKIQQRQLQQQQQQQATGGRNHRRASATTTSSTTGTSTEAVMDVDLDRFDYDDDKDTGINTAANVQVLQQTTYHQIQRTLSEAIDIMRFLATLPPPSSAIDPAHSVNDAGMVGIGGLHLLQPNMTSGPTLEVDTVYPTTVSHLGQRPRSAMLPPMGSQQHQQSLFSESAKLPSSGSGVISSRGLTKEANLISKSLLPLRPKTASVASSRVSSSSPVPHQTSIVSQTANNRANDNVSSTDADYVSIVQRKPLMAFHPGQTQQPPEPTLSNSLSASSLISSSVHQHQASMLSSASHLSLQYPNSGGSVLHSTGGGKVHQRPWSSTQWRQVAESAKQALQQYQQQIQPVSLPDQHHASQMSQPATNQNNNNNVYNPNVSATSATSALSAAASMSLAGPGRTGMPDGLASSLQSTLDVHEMSLIDRRDLLQPSPVDIYGQLMMEQHPDQHKAAFLRSEALANQAEAIQRQQERRSTANITGEEGMHDDMDGGLLERGDRILFVSVPPLPHESEGGIEDGKGDNILRRSGGAMSRYETRDPWQLRYQLQTLHKLCGHVFQVFAASRATATSTKKVKASELQRRRDEMLLFATMNDSIATTEKSITMTTADDDESDNNGGYRKAEVIQNLAPAPYPLPHRSAFLAQRKSSTQIDAEDVGIGEAALDADSLLLMEQEGSLALDDGNRNLLGTELEDDDHDLAAKHNTMVQSSADQASRGDHINNQRGNSLLTPSTLQRKVHFTRDHDTDGDDVDENERDIVPEMVAARTRTMSTGTDPEPLSATSTTEMSIQKSVSYEQMYDRLWRAVGTTGISLHPPPLVPDSLLPSTALQSVAPTTLGKNAAQGLAGAASLHPTSSNGNTNGSDLVHFAWHLVTEYNHQTTALQRLSQKLSQLEQSHGHLPDLHAVLATLQTTALNHQQRPPHPTNHQLKLTVDQRPHNATAQLHYANTLLFQRLLAQFGSDGGSQLDGGGSLQDLESSTEQHPQPHRQTSRAAKATKKLSFVERIKRVSSSFDSSVGATDDPSQQTNQQLQRAVAAAVSALQLDSSSTATGTTAAGVPQRRISSSIHQATMIPSGGSASNPSQSRRPSYAASTFVAHALANTSLVLNSGTNSTSNSKGTSVTGTRRASSARTNRSSTSASPVAVIGEQTQIETDKGVAIAGDVAVDKVIPEGNTERVGHGESGQQQQMPTSSSQQRAGSNQRITRMQSNRSISVSTTHAPGNSAGAASRRPSSSSSTASASASAVTTPQAATKKRSVSVKLPSSPKVPTGNNSSKNSKKPDVEHVDNEGVAISLADLMDKAGDGAFPQENEDQDAVDGTVNELIEVEEREGDEHMVPEPINSSNDGDGNDVEVTEINADPEAAIDVDHIEHVAGDDQEGGGSPEAKQDRKEEEEDVLAGQETLLGIQSRASVLQGDDMSYVSHVSHVSQLLQEEMSAVSTALLSPLPPPF